MAAEKSRDLAVAPPESVGVSAERVRRIDAVMKKMVDEGQLAGVVTLLNRHGKIVNFSAHGKKDIRSQAPLERDSIFRIYSMTKPVTGVAMMMLYEEGKWRLDDPVSRYIPDFAKLKVHAGENPDGTPKLEDARRSMTMRELMTHTAGLGYVISATNPVDRHVSPDRRPQSAQAAAEHDRRPREDAAARAAGHALGTTASRSTCRAISIEKFSGMSFGDFAQQRIFEPLGMKDTGVLTCRLKNCRRLALVHGRTAPASCRRPTTAAAIRPWSPRSIRRRRTLLDRVPTTRASARCCSRADSSTARACSRREPSR